MLEDNIQLHNYTMHYVMRYKLCGQLNFSCPYIRNMQRNYMFEYRCIKDTNHQIFNINRVNIVKQIDN